MPLGNTSYLQIETMAENDTNKYLIFNDGIQAVDDAINRLFAVDTSSGDVTLLESELTGYVMYDCSGHIVPRTLFIPATVGSGPVVTTNRGFYVRNNGTQPLTIDHVGSPGSSSVLATLETGLFFADGTDIITVATGSGGAGATDFLGLTDTPGAYAGQSLLGVRVNVGETALEFAAVSGAIPVEDDGVQIVAAPTALDFAGDGVTVTDNGGEALITIPGPDQLNGATLIQTIDCATNPQSQYDILNIDGFDEILVQYTDIAETVGDADINIRLSTDGGGLFDSAANYQLLFNGDSLSGTTTSFQGGAGSAVDDQDGYFSLKFPGEVCQTMFSATGISSSITFDGTYAVEGVTNAMRIFNNTANNFTGGTFRVYGINNSISKNVSIGDLLGAARGTPATGSWTEQSTGAPDVSTFSGGKVTIKHNGDRGLTRWYTPVTAGVDFDVTFKARISHDDETVTAVGVFAQNSAGALPAVQCVQLFGGSMARQEYLDVAFQNETNQDEQWNPTQYAFRYFRIERVGGTLNYYTSHSGLDWVLIFSETIVTVLSDVDRVGMVINSNGATASDETGIILDGYDTTGTQPEMASGTLRLSLQEDVTTARVAVNSDLTGNVVVEMNNAAANTYTVNTGLTGTEPVTIIQEGAGQTTIVVGGGVTIDSAGGLLALAAQFSSVVLIPRGSDTYYLAGDLA